MLSCGSVPARATGGYASLRRPKAADAILQPFALVFIRPVEGLAAKNRIFWPHRFKVIKNFWCNCLVTHETPTARDLR
jgi:hypothetical protein